MILGMLFFTSVSVADVAMDDTEPRVVYERETVIHFDPQDVDGDILRPEGTVFIERRIASFNPLITLRASFDDLMEQSVDEVK